MLARAFETSIVETGDLVFVRYPQQHDSAFDRAVLATGEATVEWMEKQGIIPDNKTTREVCQHVALAVRNEEGGGVGGANLSFVQALPKKGVNRVTAANFAKDLPRGTILYHGRLRDDKLRAMGKLAVALALEQLGKP